MRRFGLLFAGVFSLAMVAFMFSSCTEDPAPPVADIFYEIGDDGFTVAFTATTQNVTTYAWEFGDGETSTETAPSHTYGSSGDYTVTLVATGDGGSTTATKDVSIATTIEEMLTGGPGDTDGKAWVLSELYNPGIDGGGPVLDNLVIGLPSLDNVLTVFGLGDEYTDTYTFNWDGSYSVDVKNGLALTSFVHGALTQTTVSQSTDINSLPLAGATYANASGTWSLSDADHTVTVFNEFVPETTEETDITFTFPGDPANKVTRMVFSDDNLFFGVQSGTKLAIIKEITSEKIHMAIAMNGVPEYYPNPTLLLHATFVPAE